MMNFDKRRVIWMKLVESYWAVGPSKLLFVGTKFDVMCRKGRKAVSIPSTYRGGREDA
jgi:hypothetical protein